MHTHTHIYIYSHTHTVHVLTWSLTFRLSTSTTLFCRNEKVCKSDSPAYGSETGIALNCKHHSTIKKLRDPACGKRNKTTKSIFNCWQGKQFATPTQQGPRIRLNYTTVRRTGRITTDIPLFFLQACMGAPDLLYRQDWLIYFRL